MLKTVFHHVENFTTSDLRPAGWGSGEHHRLSVVAATGLRERGLFRSKVRKEEA